MPVGDLSIQSDGILCNTSVIMCLVDGQPIYPS